MFKTPNTLYLTKPDVLRALGRDMLSVARYLCSCACLYDPQLWAQAEAEATVTRESTQHLASATNAQPSYRTVDSVSPPTSDEETGDAGAAKTTEVLHHKAPIEVATVTNPLHTAVTLPPAPMAIDIRRETPTGSELDACSPVSSSSSDDEVGSARVRMAEVEDTAVGSDPNDPWHVL